MLRRIALAVLILVGGILPALAAAIPPSMWGMQFSDPTIAPWPKFFVGSTRTFSLSLSNDQAGFWSKIETARGVYSWTATDAALTVFESKGIPTEWTFAVVPGWANGNAGNNVFATNPQDFYDFVTALAQHLAARPNNVVKYFSVWNEIDNVSGFCSTGCTPAALTTYAQNIKSIVQTYIPGAVIVGPSIGSSSGVAVLGAFYAAGGGAYTSIVNAHGYAEWLTNSSEPEQFVTTDNLMLGLIKYYGLSSEMKWLDEGGYRTDRETTGQAPFWTSIYHIVRACNGWNNVDWYQFDPQNGPAPKIWGPLWDAGTPVNSTNTALNDAGIAYRVTQSMLVGSTCAAPVARVAGTNGITNTVTGTGFVAGSPGTPANTMIMGSCDTANGLTRTLSSGTEDGMTYLQISLTGTLSGTGSGKCTLQFAANNQIGTIQNQFWEECVYLNTQAMSTGASLNLQLIQQDSGGGNQSSVVNNALPTVPYSLPTQQFCFGAPATSAQAFVAPNINIQYPTGAGTVVNAVVRVGNQPVTDSSGQWKVSLPSTWDGGTAEIDWDASGAANVYPVPGAYSFAYNMTTGAQIDISSGSLDLNARPNVPVLFRSKAISGFLF